MSKGRQKTGLAVAASAEVIPFNPLDKENLGASVTRALLAQTERPLADLPAFRGCGIYALYYSGAHPAYMGLASVDADDPRRCPIYVGKAIPDGARKGGGLIDGSRSKKLHQRLQEHAESLQQAENLALADFSCRYIVVDDIWIPLGESLLIARFAPVWNSVIEGFGNHDPGRRRYEGLRPIWDVMHPGRPWAMRCRARSEADSQTALQAQAISYLCQHLA